MAINWTFVTAECAVDGLTIPQILLAIVDEVIE
jgi:hypothetical protein